VLITLISPVIGKAQFQAKLTKEATKARGIVEAIMAKEAGSRFSTGWPQSDAPNAPSSSTKFLADLVGGGFLDVDYSYFAGPGMTPAKDRAEFEANPGRHNIWCIMLDVDDTTPGNTPVIYTRNLDIDSLSFMEDEPLGSKGFAFATKNGEASVVLEAEMNDSAIFSAIFKTNSLAVLTPEG
jgi:hypothetical protein